MPKIFISYGRDASHGQNLATEAQQQLQSAGFEVFRDVVSLKPGDLWYGKLEDELISSDLVIVIVSERIRTSEWVDSEVSMAKEIGLPIIPLIAEKILMPMWLRRIQALDFSVEKNWLELLDAINDHLTISADGIPVATELVLKLPTQNHFEDIPVATELLAKSPRLLEEAKNSSYIVTAREVKSSQEKSWVPSWAANAGRDEYGQYADLEVKAVTQRFRLINSGSFRMGSEVTEKGRENRNKVKETPHQVTLSRPFWLADTACTQSLWSEVMEYNPSSFLASKNNPVELVSSTDIHRFLKILSELKLGLSFQLPTESQWEYACRAGTQTSFSFGENITSELVNYNGDVLRTNEKRGLYRGETVPVKSLPANQWGLYEMHGNVCELCRDLFQLDLGSKASIDPFNQFNDDGYYVIRGGSWNDDGFCCRSASRSWYNFTYEDYNVGFRISLDS